MVNKTGRKMKVRRRDFGSVSPAAQAMKKKEDTKGTNGLMIVLGILIVP
jgi:hypothetical protein